MDDGEAREERSGGGDPFPEPSQWAAYRLRLRQDLAENRAATVLDLALQGALVYVVAGVLYTILHIELMGLLERVLSAQFTVFADYAALAVMIGMWPLLLGTSWVCGVSGCGVM